MIMFCGLPTSVATLPILALVAIAIRCGSIGSLPRRITAMTSGVSTKQIVSFTSNAKRVPDVSIRYSSRRPGVRENSNTMSAAHSKKRAREKICGHEHHREQQHNRVVVDRAISALRCHYPGGDH